MENKKTKTDYRALLQTCCHIVNFDLSLFTRNIRCLLKYLLQFASWRDGSPTGSCTPVSVRVWTYMHTHTPHKPLTHTHTHTNTSTHATHLHIYTSRKLPPDELSQTEFIYECIGFTLRQYTMYECNTKHTHTDVQFICLLPSFVRLVCQYLSGSVYITTILAQTWVKHSISAINQQKVVLSGVLEQL